MICLTEIKNRVGVITLNRPKTINALNYEMMEVIFQALQDWQSDDAIDSVLIKGAGERGFCSGADVRAVREEVLAGKNFERFFELEYQVNLLISQYPKPYRAEMFGITMGGGLGLSAHGSIRVGDKSSIFAMPENIIGFHPDVALLWWLSRAPGEVGTHLALTGTTFGAADAKYIGILDEIQGAVPDGKLATARSWIDECYVGDDILQIVQRLERHQNPEAQMAASEINARSPLSVAVTLRAIRQAQQASIAEVLATDFILAKNLLRHPNFAEGVRAQLVDKDRCPKWQPASLAELDSQLVAQMFQA